VIEVGLLGSIMVRVDGNRVDLSGVLEKALLARLSINPGSAVSQSRLIDDLWGESPPNNAVGSLQTLVYRLRKALGPAGSAISRVDNGYKLDALAEQVDAAKFDLLVERAHRTPVTAKSNGRTLLTDALSLWRGPAFEGLDGVPFVAARRAGLEAARMSALEGRIAADLAAGADRELVAELEDLVTEHPFNESLWGHLIVALYRSGSQAAALRCYERVRVLLDEELGITPSPALASLEGAVLMQDPSLLEADLGGETLVANENPRQLEGVSDVATIVATDLEARAQLWRDAPTTMIDVIRRHDSLLVAAISRRRGRLLSNTDGTSYAVFHQPSDAIAAALEFQLAVVREPWSTIEKLPVTVAVHTGEVEVDNGNVFGPVLHVVSRLTRAAYGGQVVVTATTAELARDGLPAECELLDLGHWSLRDIGRPLHAYELRHRDLGNPFRALRGARPGTGTLPMNSTSFIGRETEMNQLTEMLVESSIVTLTGVGGVGKTRLASQFGSAQSARFPGGVWFCDLSSATTDDQIVERLAGALGLRATSTQELQRDVMDWLRFSHALLIVDNCEHVAARISTVLGPALGDMGATKLIFTSRRALSVRGEHVMRVHPLRRSTNQLAAAARDPRVTLLVERARAAGASMDTGEPSLVDIVDRVDGLPLAIELAARRLTAMTPPELLSRLSHSFDLLDTADETPNSRQALRATLDWSFGLLAPGSRRMMAALSVCEGGFGLELAEALGGAVGLSDNDVARAVADLWDQSLISTEGSVPGKARYRMLALIKEYSSIQLDLDGNRPPTVRAHAEYFARLIERLSRCPYGPQEGESIVTVEAEFDNIRQAFAWCLTEERWDLTMDLLESLVPELVLRERLEVGRWAGVALDALGEREHPVRSVASALAANMALVEGRFTDADSLGLQSLDDENRLGGPKSWLSRNVVALLRVGGSHPEDAEVFLNEMTELSAIGGDPMPHAVALFDRVLVASFSSSPLGGLGWAEDLVSFGDAWGSATLRAMGLVSVGRALAAENKDRARTALTEAVTLAEISRCGLLVDQAKRILSGIDAVAGVHDAGFRGLTDLLRSGHSGDLSQQLQTVVSALEPLVTVDAIEVATVLCGALSQTALGSVAQCERVLALARTRLSGQAYRTAFSRGSELSPAQLVDLAANELERLSNLESP
jgi:predicted ATPase/DNA-binding SARP family transcriptional activator/class 3 adenylate cyclase